MLPEYAGEPFEQTEAFHTELTRETAATLALRNTVRLAATRRFFLNARTAAPVDGPYRFAANSPGSMTI